MSLGVPKHAIWLLLCPFLRLFRACPDSPRRWAVDLFYCGCLISALSRDPQFSVGGFRLLAASARCWIRCFDMICRWTSHFERAGFQAIWCASQLLRGGLFFVFPLRNQLSRRAFQSGLWLMLRCYRQRLARQNLLNNDSCLLEFDAIVGRGPCIKGLCVHSSSCHHPYWAAIIASGYDIELLLVFSGKTHPPNMMELCSKLRVRFPSHLFLQLCNTSTLGGSASPFHTLFIRRRYGTVRSSISTQVIARYRPYHDERRCCCHLLPFYRTTS